MDNGWLILGGTGFIGKNLIKFLLKNNVENIIVLTRNTSHARKILPPEVKIIDLLDKIENPEIINIVVNLAGEPIADKRWNDKLKEKFENSRIKLTDNLISYLDSLDKKPKLLINSSAIGYYGYCKDEFLTETSPPQDVYISKLCQDWENAAKKASTLGIKVSLLRTGIVLGKNGGILAKMIPAFKLGVGGKLGSGNQWVSWIHIEDYINIIKFIAENMLEGPINATAPNPATNLETSKTLAKILKKPCFCHIPSWFLKLVFGEMAESLLLNSQRVIPQKLLTLGFKFKYQYIKEALLNILDKPNLKNL